MYDDVEGALRAAAAAVRTRALVLHMLILKASYCMEPVRKVAGELNTNVDEKPDGQQCRW